MRIRVLSIGALVLVASAVAAWWWIDRASSPPTAIPARPVAATHPAPANEALQTTTAPSAAPAPQRISLPTLHGELALAGRVIDESGQPIPGATVKLASESVLSLSPLVKRLCDCSCGELLIRCRCARAKKLLPELVRKADAEPPAQASTTAGTDGSFGFANLAQDRYRVWARAPGMAAGWASNVAVGTAEAVPTEITLTPAVEVRGSVRTETHDAVRGATVVALSELEVGGIGRVLSATDGRFSIPSLGSATYYLYASARGFASALESEVSPGDDVVLTLARGGVLAGHVQDARGAGVADATVQVIGAESESPRTRADGSFRVEDLGAGKYKIWAEKGTQTSEAIQQIELARGESKEDVVLRLDEGATIAGRAFTSPNDAPVTGAKIGLHQEHRGAVREAWSDDDGHYELAGVPPGVYTMAVDASDARLAEPITVTVAARERRTVDLSLERGATLEGRVTDSGGTPVVGATIQPQDRTAKKAKSDAKGEFRIDGLAGSARPSGADGSETSGASVDIEVTHPAFIAKHVRAGGLVPGESVRVDVALERGGAILGMVLGPDDEPLDGIGVAIVRHRESEAANAKGASRRGAADDDEEAEDVTLPSAASKHGGRFELRGIPEGTFDLQAEGKGMIRLKHGPIQIATEQVVDGITLRLALGEVIEGQVVSTKGDPLADVYVWARSTVVPTDDAASNPWSKPATTDRDGRFHLAGLDSGTYVLHGMKDGLERAEVSGIHSGTHDARIEMKAATKLVGRVVDAASGEPIHSFRIDYHRFTTADGTFTYPGLSKERKTATVVAEGYATVTLGPFDADAGTEVQVGTVRLTTGATIRGSVIDARGRPRAGIRIMAMRSDLEAMEHAGMDGGVEPATADAEGRFALRGLGPGTWSLMTFAPHADDDDTSSMGWATVTIVGSETHDGIVIRAGDRAGLRDMMTNAIRMQLLRDTSPAVAKRLGPAVDAVAEALSKVIDPAAEDADSSDPATWASRIESMLPSSDRSPEVQEVLKKLEAQSEAATSASP